MKSCKLASLLIAMLLQFAMSSFWMLSSSGLCQESSTQALVEASWLAEHITDQDVCVIDLSHRIKNYNEGHIPGALFVDWKVDIINSEKSDRYALPEKEAWEKLLSSLGIKPETHIVLTDNLDSRAAVRMYWTLKYFGHSRVSVLNGGTDGWQTAGNAVSVEVPSPASSNYQVEKTDAEILASMQRVRDAIDDQSARLLDGRPANQYTGEVPGKVFNTGKEHKRRGHVSHAKNIPWALNLDDAGKFKSIKELKSLYAENGVDEGDEVITYCNEGLHAAMPWFVLHELLGEKNITLYDDSMAEWANRDDTPMEKTDDQ